MGSFPSDLTLKVNIDPASAIANFKKIEDSIKKGAQGIAGEYEKAAKLGQDMAKQMIDVSTRAGRQLENQLRSIEKQTTSLGKTQVEMNEMQRRWMLERARGLKNQEEQEKRINAIYDQRRKYFQEEERKQQQRGPGTGALLFRGARDIFEGRMSYGVMDIGRAGGQMLGLGGGEGGLGSLIGGAGGAGGLTAALTSAPVLLAATAAGFGAVMIASAKAAESVGQYAQSVHDVQIVTGMSAREVQQFQVAAKVTGQDVSILERMMRGLTQAVADNSSQGQKARQTLKDMGVDLYSLQSGEMSTMQLFEQVSAALEKQPNRWMRNKEVIDLFKRAGIEALPVITELRDTLQRTGGMDFMAQGAIDQFTELHKQTVLLGAQWEQFKLSVESFIAKPAIFIMRIITDDAQASASQRFQRQFDVKMTPNGPVVERRKPESPIENMITPEFQERLRLQGQRQQYLGYAETHDLEAAEKKLGDLRRTMDDLREKPIWSDDTLSKLRQATAEYDKQKKLVDGLKQSETDRKAITEALRRLDIEAKERAAHPYGMLAADQRLKAIQEIHGITDAQVATAAGYLAPVRAEEVQMRVQRAVDQARAAAQRVAEVLGVEQPLSATQFAEQGRATTAARSREFLESLKRQTDEAREALKPLLEIQTEYRKNEEQAALRSVRLGGILQAPTIETRLATEAQIAQVRERAADQEAEDAKSRLAQEYTTKENYENALVAIRLKHEGEVAAAREEYQAKYLEELRHQVDDIKGKIEPLYQTLFTQPSKFGNQLRQTVQEAALHPIVSGLSEMTATALHPLIFGASGTGGIAGGFRSIFGGGRLNDVKLTPDGAVPVHIVGGGGIGTSIYSAGGYYGGGGTAGFGGGGTFPSLGPGGTAGFTGPVDLGGGAAPDLYNLPMAGPGVGSNLAMMTLGAALGVGRGGAGGGGGGFRLGGGGTFNPAAFLKNLKGSFWNENIALAPGVYQAASSMGVGGKLAGVLTSQGGAQLELGAGLPLAMAGITGQRRGTAGGIAESAFGGMLTGAGIGTMILPGIGTAIGAGIGAAAGLGIGLGEMLAGVESPRNEAKRLAQAIYHISINNTTADQIVSIANQSYGGRVSIAVRSPEVRHMLGLYAAGTGQGGMFQQGLNEPHGASLVESGGSLYQQATYQYGQAFSQSSSLPIYGGSPTHVLGAPGGGVNLSLNIGGQSAAQFLQGNVVSPDVISTQMASAMQGSNGRVPQALMMSEPGSIAS